MTGAVCATSKEKDFLNSTIKKLKQHVKDLEPVNKLSTRDDMCNYIMSLLMYLEKYSTTKDGNKMTYMMIPNNHPKYEFPYNLEDRVKNTINNIKSIIDRDFDYVVEKEKNGKFENLKNLPNYIVKIKRDKYIDENINDIKKMGFKEEGKMLVQNIN